MRGADYTNSMNKCITPVQVSMLSTDCSVNHFHFLQHAYSTIWKQQQSTNTHMEIYSGFQLIGTHLV